MPENKLEMRFDPTVIEHLGVRMYSTLPPVLSELIANAYDADAEKVQVNLHDKEEKKIIVTDDGIGMSHEDIQKKFLVIGRNRREDGDEITPKGRKPIGKKGLGKLSFFGIVQKITVRTIKNGKKNVFMIDWKDLMASKGEIYRINQEVHDQPVDERDGTTIELTKLKRKSEFSEEDIARSISRYFVFEKGFTVTVSRNGGKFVTVENEMRFDLQAKEFEWTVPDNLEGTNQHGYLQSRGIKGKIITYKSPISAYGLPRGIALFSRGKLVQEPSYFSKSTSSHFFSYLSGWLNVDFIDDLDEDVISTNRKNLNWENPIVSQLEENLRECISHIQKDWRAKRKEENSKKIDERLSPEWFESMPSDTRQHVKNLAKKIQDPPVGEGDLVVAVADQLMEIFPPYPRYHWRHLHENLKDQRLFRLYKKEEYLAAAEDGVEIYAETVREKSGVDENGTTLFNKAFGNKGLLEIQHPFRRESGKNIQAGQRSLSTGLMESFRNPTAHDPQKKKSQFFTEDDCLDILSLISFLLRRVDKAKIDKAKKVKQTSKQSSDKKS